MTNKQAASRRVLQVPRMQGTMSSFGVFFPRVGVGGGYPGFGVKKTLHMRLRDTFHLEQPPTSCVIFRCKGSFDPVLFISCLTMDERMKIGWLAGRHFGTIQNQSGSGFGTVLDRPLGVIHSFTLTVINNKILARHTRTQSLRREHLTTEYLSTTNHDVNVQS
jgi:hypothetical protein